MRSFLTIDKLRHNEFKIVEDFNSRRFYSNSSRVPISHPHSLTPGVSKRNERIR